LNFADNEKIHEVIEKNAAHPKSKLLRARDEKVDSQDQREPENWALHYGAMVADDQFRRHQTADRQTRNLVKQKVLQSHDLTAPLASLCSSHA
jgi:hypothetical protein